jgi:hypothetical protein
MKQLSALEDNIIDNQLDEIVDKLMSLKQTDEDKDKDIVIVTDKCGTGLLADLVLGTIISTSY